MEKRREILIVDDEQANLSKLKRTFIDEFVVHEAENGEQALSLLSKHKIAAIITDQRMPGLSGVELLKRSLEISPGSIRIVLTGYTDVEDLMEAINQGQVHRYITKPWEPNFLRETVIRELERWELKSENERLAFELKEANARLARENIRLKKEIEVFTDGRQGLIYQGGAMADLLHLLDRVVQTDSTVLIQGETGTGKELLARYIHEGSSRVGEAFIPVNCGAIPADLVESSFFGHRKGAFTGAGEDRKGFFELAHRGTLFLDEIGEAPPDLQVKLLRVLQEGEIFPVGAEKPMKVDVRIIASTNRNLRSMVEAGRFRQDLFFRLHVFSVQVPPLRARQQDIAVLAHHFLAELSRGINKQVPGFEPETLKVLRQYEWPGNVRELENEIERLVILCEPGRPITPDLLSDRLHFTAGSAGSTLLKDQLSQLERRLILEALSKHSFNKSQTAKALGITRQTIISKLKQYSDD